MVPTCVKCGRVLGVVERLESSWCRDCERRFHADAENAAQAAAEQQGLTRLEMSRAAGLRGEASPGDFKTLADDGFLIVLGRLVSCPICGYEQFRSRETVLHPMFASLAEIVSFPPVVSVYVCRRCAHVLLFERPLKEGS
ncbi:MAG TPA: hypothetical protein VGE52_01190 [Pirellulales bacterium]